MAHRLLLCNLLLLPTLASSTAAVDHPPDWAGNDEHAVGAWLEPAPSPVIYMAEANPTGLLKIVMGNLSGHTSVPVREWLACHPRVEQVPIPTGACRLNLQEGWWRLFRTKALAGQCFADAGEITRATALATRHLNRRANPWVWGRPAPRHRHLRRYLTCRL